MTVADDPATLATGARDDLDTYTYERLELSSTIRLLRLYPGTGDDPLYGELDHTELPHDTSWNKIRRIRKRDEYLRCVNAQPQMYRNEDIERAIQLLDREESPDPASASDKPSPAFEAVSYVWGVPDFNRAMVSPAGVIWLTPNLEYALKAVRLPDCVRVLWADAVCINQCDIEERGRQVQMMGWIYRSAEQVLVWLGTDPQRHCSAYHSHDPEHTVSW